MDLMQTMLRRRSVRTFDGRDLTPADQARVLMLCRESRNPFDLPITWRLLEGQALGLSSPVIVGSDTWLTGKLARGPRAEEAFGFAFEDLLLRAEAELGLGTVWIAGTMNRGAFEKAMALEENEVMPCVSPLGYPAEKLSIRESLMRKGVKADQRLPFGSLFFRENFSTPLAQEGPLGEILEAVRRAPSAVNKQPWRCVLQGRLVHFYEKPDKGYVDKTGWDLQRVDLGIALCHFLRAAEALGREAALRLEDPGLETPEGIRYVATWALDAPL